MKPKPIVILGAGGLAREVAEYVQASGAFELHGFVDVDPMRRGEVLNGVPIIGVLGDLPEGSGWWGVAGAGDIAPRRRQVAEMLEAGLAPATVVHPAAVVSPSASVGAGTIVAPTSVISSNAVIADHSLVNYGATIGHDVTVGECCVVGPGARVSGWCTLEPGCYLGAGAIILPRITIGTGATIGAGAVVTRDVPPGMTVVGVPAVELKPNRRVG
ncbi:MAG: acetyltransferase [Coriobacteriia bacterium]